MAKELTRLIRITDANLRQSHLYLNGASGFFPRDSFGPSSRAVGVGRPLHLDVEGLHAPVLTDIPKDAKTGRPRGFFRKRSWVREQGKIRPSMPMPATWVWLGMPPQGDDRPVL